MRLQAPRSGATQQAAKSYFPSRIAKAQDVASAPLIANMSRMFLAQLSMTSPAPALQVPRHGDGGAG
jgi:hypothetical protein